MEESDRLSALHDELLERLGRQRYALWIGPHTTLSLDSDSVTVECQTEFELAWLRRRLHKILVECCGNIMPADVSVNYQVNEQEAEAAEITAPPQPQVIQPQITSSQVAPNNRVTAQKSSFDNFVVGRTNELAYRTAQSVSSQIGHYGPLMMFGPPGVGKTHLVYSMLQTWKRSKGQVRALRLTAEQFTGEFLDALDRRALPSFRQKYRTVDALVIEDIQFLGGKRATLDEMLYTVDTLNERHRQIVLTCDRSPAELQKVSGELVSRITGGLTIPIENPDFETRLGITRRLAMQRGILLDDEITALVASQVGGSARQLSGALNLLLATSQAHSRKLDIELARTTLADWTQLNSPSVRLPDIQRAVCQVFGVEPGNLKSKSKARSLAEPRMLAMCLARKYTRCALGEISSFFGRSSHSSVISAQKKVDKLVSQGAQIHVANRECSLEDAIREIESALRSA